MKRLKILQGAALTVVVIIGLVFLGIAAFYFYTQSDQYTAKYGKIVSVAEGPSGEKVVRKTAPEKKPEGQTVSVGDGLSQYTIAEWGITFAYPSNWKLTEGNSNIVTINGQFSYGGELESVKVAGDGYVVHFNNTGRGYPADQSTITEYTVGGKKERTFEDKFGNEYWQAMGACDVALEISRPIESKEITDKIIASVKCSVE